MSTFFSPAPGAMPVIGRYVVTLADSVADVPIYNEHGQPVTIDGTPGGRPETHIPIEEKPPQ